MSEGQRDDRPWTEEEWERFMRESDVRSAKFGELLETFHDHPDCEEIIAREMGWDRDEAAGGVEVDWPAVEEAFTDEEWEEYRRRDEAALRAIPAYTRGYAWGLQVHRALKPFFPSGEPDPHDDLVLAVGNAPAVSAKIAGGHGMGYDDDALCGNIVNCKRGLEAAEASLAALERLAERGTLPASVIDPLLEEGREVRRLLTEHIAGLRSRVWWD